MEDAKNKAKGAAVKPKRAKGRKTAVKRRTKTRKLPPYNVVLLDDQLHTYDYVIEMLRGVFGYNEINGYLLAKAVDTHGRVIVFQTHKELAELKRDQIIGFGADMRIAASKCGMAATVEPAEAD